MLESREDTIHLVKRAQAGNTEAFTLLVQKYEREIYGYLIGLLGDHDEACDFAQQVFLKAWLSLTTLNEASYFKSWLYTIARNLTYDYWRRKKILCQSWETLEVDNITDGMPELEDQVVKAELVNLALAEISQKLRHCLLLRVVGGFSDYEIARIVEISETSVSTYVCSARRWFRAAYERLENEQEIGEQADERSKTNILCHLERKTRCNMS